MSWQSPNLVVLIITLISTVSSQSIGSGRYPATIQTKGSSTSGTAQVDLKNFDNYDQIFFNYDAIIEMGSSLKLNIKASTADGDGPLSADKQPGEEFTRVITQKVTKSRDANGLHLSVLIETKLLLAQGKEKYGKTTIGVRVLPGRRGAHYWDIKHEISNNYEGEGEGEICLGCDVDEKEVQIDPAFNTPPPPVFQAPEESWGGKPFVCNWKVDDLDSQNHFSADVVSDGTVVRGEYRVLMPDGRTQVVTYTADWNNGYRPVVRYE